MDSSPGSSSCPHTTWGCGLLPLRRAGSRTGRIRIQEGLERTAFGHTSAQPPTRPGFTQTTPVLSIPGDGSSQDHGGGEWGGDWGEAQADKKPLASFPSSSPWGRQSQDGAAGCCPHSSWGPLAPSRGLERALLSGEFLPGSWATVTSIRSDRD